MIDIVERLRVFIRFEHPKNYETHIVWQAADEIERLREALRHYVRECDCHGGTYHEDDHITGKTLVKDCPKCEPARTALEEKE